MIDDLIAEYCFMKRIILLLIFIFPIISYSQSENLVDVTWRCTTIVIEGDVIQAPQNDEVYYVLLEMTEDNDPFTEDFVSGVCNYLTSSDSIVTYNNPESTFTISQLIQTLITCDYAENGFFENNYFNFFYNNINTPLSYEIYTNDDTNALTITASNGDIAKYEEFVLGVEENQLKQISIYPNPAIESFTINSNIDSIDRIEIYSITGQLLKSIIGSITTIDISSFSKGTYFIKFYSAENFVIKQFVKN